MLCEKMYFLFITCFVAWISLAISANEETCKWPGYVEIRCLPEGRGYATYECTENKHLGVNVWRQISVETRCRGRWSKCRCYDDAYWNWSEQGCECIDPRTTPNFPDTGIIRWSGTTVVGRLFEVVGDGKVRGEVRKNSDGFYLKKTWSHLETPEDVTMNFEIIIPLNLADKRFIKYSGSDESRTCKIEETGDEGDLSSIWKKPNIGKGFTLASESKKKDGVVEQVWDLRNDVESDVEIWRWTVTYYEVGKYAIPTSFYHYYYDDIESESTRKNLKYEYHHDDDESFMLEDYCDNTKK